MTTIEAPTPKYAIGQTVWRVDTRSERRQMPCPDCLDTRRWECVSPVGERHTLDCPRCTSGYSVLGHNLPSLVYTATTYAASPVVIDGMEVQTRGHGAPFVRYYWGSVSNSQYVDSETSLWATEEEASAEAARRTAEAEQAQREHPHHVLATHFASLPIQKSESQKTWDAVWHAQYRVTQLRERFGGTFRTEDGELRKHWTREDVEAFVHEWIWLTEDYWPTHSRDAGTLAERLVDAARDLVSTANTQAMSIDVAALRKLVEALEAWDAALPPAPPLQAGEQGASG